VGDREISGEIGQKSIVVVLQDDGDPAWLEFCLLEKVQI